MLAAQTINLTSKLLPEASINLKHKEVLISNAASNEISFPSFVKVNCTYSRNKKNTPISMILQILDLEGAI